MNTRDSSESRIVRWSATEMYVAPDWRLDIGVIFIAES